MYLESPRPSPEIRSSEISDFQFAMEASGFSLSRDGTWDPGGMKTIEKDLEPFGYMFRSNAASDWSLIRLDTRAVVTTTAFAQKPVLDVIQKYRELDEDEARRISFLLGFAARSLQRDECADITEIAKAASFIGSMTSLGQRKSGEAIAAAMAMYVLVGESLEDDPDFKGHVYRMVEAITEDPIIPLETEDLGLSQAYKLLGFDRKIQNPRTQDYRPVPSIARYRHDFRSCHCEECSDAAI